MELQVVNQAGKAVKTVQASDYVFAAPFNEAVVHQALVRQLANARQGTACTKTRGEVSGSSRKLFRQKHTGNARAGSIKNPLRRGGGVTFGPMCRVGGEIECTIFQGHTNKAHDGFLGHSYVGEWVNLGAGTTNSDLKNNYSPVRVTLAGRIHDTGMLKMGSLLGDHVKTGIGTLLNTGGVVGTGCSIFGGGVQPTFVPPFVWGGGGRYQEYRMKDFIETAARVMLRRELTLEENQRRLLESVYHMTGPERVDWLAGRKEG